MKSYTLSVEGELSRADAEALIARVEARGLKVDRHEEKLCAFMWGRRDEMLGGVYGRLANGWLYIDKMWVHESLRGQDYGTRLMRSVERAALARGVRRVFLCTFSFQARPFYERLGYRVLVTYENFLAGYTLYVMTNDHLSPPDSAAGLFEVDSAPDPRDIETLTEHLDGYSRTITGDFASRPLALLLRDEGGALAGGIMGWHFAHLLEDAYLWIDEGAREAGWWSKMVERLDRELSQERSVYTFLRVSGDYGLSLAQAGGYDLAGMQKDLPDGHNAYYLKKRVRL